MTKKQHEKLGALIEQYDVLEKFRAVMAALDGYVEAIKVKNNPKLGMKATQLYLAKREATLCLGKFLGILNEDGEVKQ